MVLYKGSKFQAINFSPIATVFIVDVAMVFCTICFFYYTDHQEPSISILSDFKISLDSTYNKPGFQPNKFENCYKMWNARRCSCGVVDMM